MIKQNRQFSPVFLLILMLFLSNLCSCSPIKSGKVSKSDFVLNTTATITIYDKKDEKLIDDCFNLCRKYESLLSRTIEDSEISLLNSRKTSLVSDETAELISQGLYFSRLSGGSFDITIEPLSSLWNFSAKSPSLPSEDEIDEAKSRIGYEAVTVTGNTVTFENEYTRLDLGAIAKGYVADKVKDYLVSQGVERAIINLGGNVQCIGGKTDKSGFEVGIQRPFDSGSIAGVSISDMSVVTSGTYERYFVENGKSYHHILDPKTGYPFENGLLSVTIIGKSSSYCDALSTACFALGKEEGMELINDMDGYYAIFITDDYKLHLSNGAETALKISY
ncbi:MAG: FAD:protein FMN transferase [Oscillospiraceae bacterium]